MTRQSLSVSLGYIAQIPFNFSLLDVHMWYIYLLIGLYLYLPIFSAWVEKVSDKAKLWFLAGWGVTLFIPYYREFVSPYIWVDAHGMNSVCFIISPGLTVTCYWGIICGIMIGR